MATGRKTGGRTKGTRNKATADIKAALQKRGDELVKALLKLTRSDDERVRLGAIQACFDRGWGKAVQSMELDMTMQVTAITRTIVDPKLIEHVVDKGNKPALEGPKTERDIA